MTWRWRDQHSKAVLDEGLSHPLGEGVFILVRTVQNEQRRGGSRLSQGPAPQHLSFLPEGRDSFLGLEVPHSWLLPGLEAKLQRAKWSNFFWPGRNTLGLQARSSWPTNEATQQGSEQAVIGAGQKR
jgi:hypothetical protein